MYERTVMSCLVLRLWPVYLTNAKESKNSAKKRAVNQWNGTKNDSS